MSTEEEEARKKALWTSFQASVSESAPTSTQLVLQRMVKVQKRYRFAGEEITEVIEVPEDSPEAKKWPTWHPADALQVSSASVSSVVPSPIPTSPEDTRALAPTTPTPPNGRRPGPRKPKTQLAELPGRSTPRAKKLTTLDKSVMDWKAHVQSSGDVDLQDELEANRRGGGFLGKVDFLQRVGERKDAVFEAVKSNKRRRP